MFDDVSLINFTIRRKLSRHFFIFLFLSSAQRSREECLLLLFTRSRYRGFSTRIFDFASHVVHFNFRGKVRARVIRPWFRPWNYRCQADSHLSGVDLPSRWLKIFEKSRERTVSEQAIANCRKMSSRGNRIRNTSENKRRSYLPRLFRKREKKNIKKKKNISKRDRSFRK